MDSSLRQTLAQVKDSDTMESSLGQTATQAIESSSTSSPTRQTAAQTIKSPLRRTTTPTLASPLRQSPSKTDSGRRVALATLDVNAPDSKRAIEEEERGDDKKRQKLILDHGDEDREPFREQRHDDERLGEHDEKRQNDDSSTRSSSPEVSSVFDTSVADASWATAATNEPDTEAGIPRATATVTAATMVPRRLTREQAREKVEVLRLRLGLASYKVRTGQTSVPLAELQPRPLRRESTEGGP